jgi:hypothetical protein
MAIKDQKRQAIRRGTSLFVSAAALVATVSATWGYDWLRPDGGEPKIYCSQQVAQDRNSAILTYSTDPVVDSPQATIVYGCMYAYYSIDTTARLWKCTVRNGTEGGKYQLNGSSEGELHYGTIPSELCDAGYKAMHIWAKKKWP